VVQETLAAGGQACIPAFPREGLSESFIDPAVAWLLARGATLRTGSRVTALHTGGDRATALDDTPIGDDEAVILAVPAPVATSLLPGLDAPDRFQAILNVHYRIDADPGPAGFIGLVGGIAEWIFIKSGVVSITISAANSGLDTPPDALAQQVWKDVRAALHLPETIPAYRVVKEKRATFAATPEQEARRPGIPTALRNVVLAGDWTATGLPATIEGAIRSGRAAAAAFL
jgi:predicted NAD/FAD-dependent oxidoreductase